MTAYFLAATLSPKHSFCVCAEITGSIMSVPIEPIDYVSTYRTEKRENTAFEAA